MSTYVGTLRRSRLYDSTTVAWVGIAIGVLAFVLAIPPVTARSAVWPVLLGIVAVLFGIVAVSRGVGRVGWGGPCPPSGSHTYRFRLYALDGPLALAGAPTSREVREAFSGASILGVAELTCTYQRVPQASASR